MSLTAVTVLKSGRVFTPEWVTRINRQIREHIKPSRIVCLTDMDVKDCEVIPLKHGWPGWFSKIELFRPGLFNTIDDFAVVYFDLDTLIVKLCLDVLWTDMGITMLSDFYTPTIPASGMMMWCPKKHHVSIYEDFAKNPQFPKSWRHGDGSIIGKYCGGRIQDIWPGLVGSYKAHHLQAGPKDYKIVCFHGTPKQCDLPPDNWARWEWEKTK